MSGGQGKSFINLGSKLRVSIAQQDYADKYVEFVVQPTDYICLNIYSSFNIDDLKVFSMSLQNSLKYSSVRIESFSWTCLVCVIFGRLFELRL